MLITFMSERVKEKAYPRRKVNCRGDILIRSPTRGVSLQGVNTSFSHLTKKK